MPAKARYRRSLAAFLVAMSLAAPGLAGPFREQIELYDAYNFEGALIYWRTLAAEGNINALSALNDGYHAAGATPEEMAEAVAWTRAAAAEDGNWKGRVELGVLHLRGQGVAHDADRAAHLFAEAAALGGVEASMLLAMMHRNGISVDVDGAEAERWLIVAAGKGHAPALLQLGRMYLNGHAVEPDRVQAYKWFAVAAARLDDAELRGEALMMRDTAAFDMTPAEVARAQALADAWQIPD